MGILNDYIGVLSTKNLKSGINAPKIRINKTFDLSNTTKTNDSKKSLSSYFTNEKHDDSVINPNAELLKAYFLPKSQNSPKIAFGRALEDHLSYGANYLGDNKTNFKILAPKVNTMHVEIVKKEDISPDKDLRKAEGKEFYWNYEADPDVKSRIIPMNQNKKGVFEVSAEDVKPGDIYRFVLNGKESEGKISGDKRKDPNSKSVFDIFGWSEVVNDVELKNGTHNWIKNDKIAELVIDELHIGLLGGFNKAKERINEIAERGVVNTIEIMPIAEFYKDKNWGYDGVDLFASESSYGKPEEFKALINHAHDKGLKVILDVVPNHLGPFGNVINDFGPAFDSTKSTPWGGALNFDGKGNEYMRRHMVDMSLHWLNMGVDGIRYDMTQFMASDSALKLINAEVKNHFPEAITIMEDGRNSKRIVSPLLPNEIEDPESGAEKNLHRIGANAQWNFDFQHTLEALVTDTHTMGFAPSVSDLEDEFKFGFKWFENPNDKNHPPKADTNLVYHASHDDPGNRGGIRTIERIMMAKLKICDRITDNDWKKGNGAILDLTKAYLANANKEEWTNIQKKYHINKTISKQEFGNIYEQAQALNRLALGAVFMNPGPKMILMGDDEATLTPFKFFAEYPENSKDEKGVAISKKVSDEKGYSVGKEAFEDSKLDQNVYSDPKLKENTIKFSQALSKLIKNNPALSNGKAEWENLKTFHHNQAKVLQIHRIEGDNEILAVMNFSDKDYDAKNKDEFVLRGLTLPDNKWEEILNSDYKEFGGSNLNNADIKLSAKSGEMKINLPKQSIVIFKKTN